MQHELTRQLPQSRSLLSAHNAPVESFFGLLKRERVRHRIYQTKDAVRADVFDCIEMFYNLKRAATVPMVICRL